MNQKFLSLIRLKVSVTGSSGSQRRSVGQIFGEASFQLFATLKDLSQVVLEIGITTYTAPLELCVDYIDNIKNPLIIFDS